MTAAPPASSRLTRTLLVLVAILVGIIVALLAGILVMATGGSVAAAATSAGVAFGGTVPLVLLIENSLGLS
jgi:hypothetical protein